jgi:hypothetical protein
VIKESRAICHRQHALNALTAKPRDNGTGFNGLILKILCPVFMPAFAKNHQSCLNLT